MNVMHRWLFAKPATPPSCSGCGHPIDVTRRHVTLARHVEQVDRRGRVRVLHAQVITWWHLDCDRGA